MQNRIAGIFTEIHSFLGFRLPVYHIDMGLCGFYNKIDEHKDMVQLKKEGCESECFIQI